MFTIVFGCFIALLIAFVHFITVPSAVFTTDFAIVFEVFLFHQLSLPRLFFARSSFFCCCTTSTTDLREIFSLSGVFYLTIFPDIWHNLLLSRFPWGRRFHLEGSRASHWGSKYRPAHMFVWITQYAAKGIVRRLCLCI